MVAAATSVRSPEGPERKRGPWGARKDVRVEVASHSPVIHSGKNRSSYSQVFDIKASNSLRCFTGGSGSKSCSKRAEIFTDEATVVSAFTGAGEDGKRAMVPSPLPTCVRTSRRVGSIRSPVAEDTSARESKAAYFIRSIVLAALF